MFYGNTVGDTRKLFFSSWFKYQQKVPLTPLEEQLVNVIIEHPEYHKLFNDKEQYNDPEQIPLPEFENPFLHLGLHLTIRDQITTNRPQNITSLYQKLMAKHQDPHVVEHLLMEPLTRCLWEAQQNQSMPDEASYLENCEALAQ